jgi:hypothetical protein
MDMNKQDCVLFLTAGRSDIRIVLHDGMNHERLCEIKRDSTSAFHGWLRQHLSEVEFVACPDKGGGELRDVAFKEGEFSFADRGQAPSPMNIPDDKIKILFPKLEKVLTIVEQSDDWCVLGAVIYYTDRQNVEGVDQKHKIAEPFAVGDLLQRWISKRLNLLTSESDMYEPGKVVCMNYLQGKAIVEGRGRDYPLFRSIAALIEAPLRESRRQHPDATLVISDMGGLPVLKPLLRAAGGMFFGTRVRHWIDSEDNPDSARLGSHDEGVSAEQSYQTRRVCLQLLRRGDFFGAWNAARWVAHDQLESTQWVSVLQVLAELFDGRWRPAARASDAFPNQWLLSNNLNFCPRALVIALRIEAALLRGSLIEAMSLTCNFSKAAVLDGIARFLMVCSLRDRDQNPVRCAPLLAEEDVLQVLSGKLRIRGRVSNEVKDGIEKTLSDFAPTAGLMQSNGGVLSWTLPFGEWEPRQDTLFSDVESAWLALIDKVEFRTVRDLEFKPLLPALERYRKCLIHVNSGEISSPYAIGHHLPAAMPGQQELMEAANRFVTDGLWRTASGKVADEGAFCLDVGLVDATLKALGVNQYEGLFDGLVNQAEEYLLASEMR